MTKKCVPMIHVTNVRATVAWYQGIGFTAVETFGDGDDLTFAFLSFGSTEVMFNAGGRPSSAERREVDLYVYTENVDAVYEQLRTRVDIVEGPHDTFYGMREVIVRDPDRFWVTFGEPSAGALLTSAVEQRDVEGVRAALKRAVSPERLSTALADAAREDRHSPEITALLQQAGAIPLPVIDVEMLRSHTGTYTSDDGTSVRITLEDGSLRAFPDDAQAVRLVPVDAVTFKPLDFTDASIVFVRTDAQTSGLTYTQGSKTTRLRRIT